MVFAVNKLNMMSPLVNLHIVGVQKAGTTALAHFLSQHPDVCVVEGKEAHVFDQPDFAQKDKKTYANRRYSKKLSHYAGEKIICDATPITILNKVFLNDCYSYNPEAKFIVLLREPVERAVSHYYMSKQRGREKHNMLWSFMMEKYRLRSVPEEDAWLSGSVWRENTYLKRGEYKAQIADLLSIVPSSQCLILHQEALLNAHEQTLQRVMDFLGLPKCTIEPEKVFASDKNQRDKTETLARLYATAYFFIKRELPYRS